MDLYVVTFSIRSNNSWGHELVMINTRAKDGYSAVDKARQQLDESYNYPSVISVAATIVTDEIMEWARKE